MSNTWSGVGRPPVRVIDGKKDCSKCKEHLPISDFNRDSHAASGYSGQCKKCRASPGENIKRTGMTARELKIDSVLWTKYRIRLSDYNRMFDEQEGRCRICCVEPIGEIYEKLCVDQQSRDRQGSWVVVSGV